MKVKQAQNNRQMYKLFSVSGIIKNWFHSEELVDMRSVHFAHLHDLDPGTLVEVTIIQASRAETGWQTVASLSSKPTVCKCKGNCTTKKCCCRKVGIECGTKCHPDNRSCKNSK